MELVNLKHVQLSSFSMGKPEKVDDENKIYLAPATGPMVYFKAHVYVNEDHEYSIVNESYQHFVESLTSHFQEVCSAQSESGSRVSTFLWNLFEIVRKVIMPFLIRYMTKIRGESKKPMLYAETTKLT